MRCAVSRGPDADASPVTLTCAEGLEATFPKWGMFWKNETSPGLTTSLVGCYFQPMAQVDAASTKILSFQCLMQKGENFLLTQGGG